MDGTEERTQGEESRGGNEERKYEEKVRRGNGGRGKGNEQET